MVVLQIEHWNHVSPILLPFENSSTMAAIMSSSLGVLIPAIVFVFFMFNHLHNIWMTNVHDSPSHISHHDRDHKLAFNSHHHMGYRPSEVSVHGHSAQYP